jgi:hypothetical protein
MEENNEGEPKKIEMTDEMRQHNSAVVAMLEAQMKQDNPE